MLNILKIKNVALMKDVEINFSDGFNALFGETGAGKSIIINSLNFVLGAKADKTLIRSGEESMRVEAAISFSSKNKEMDLLLNDYGIENEGQIILSRSLTLSGKSDARINGTMISIATLKMFGDRLVDIFGQHFGGELLNEKNHLSILDDFCGDCLNASKDELKKLFQFLKDVNSEIKKVCGTEEERERKLDLLSYQISEIEKVAPKKDEDISLKEEISKLSNAEKIKTNLELALNECDGNVNIKNSLKITIRELDSISEFSQEILQIKNRLTDIMFEADDCISLLKDFSNNFVCEEFELERLLERNDELNKLKKKYGNSIDEVFLRLTEAKQEKENLLNCEEELAKLSKEKLSILGEINAESLKLSDIRKKLAKIFEKQMVDGLCDLSMKNVVFEVVFKKNILNDDLLSNVYCENGTDDVSFFFSANAGQDKKELSKTISGGEMSRFMLVLKTLLKNNQIGDDKTFVFDEIDAGISGEVGLMVAKKLAKISINNQVICISHMPQVCAMATSNLLVSKKTVENQTFSSCKNLTKEEKISAIANMASGNDSLKNSRGYANELIDWCETFKKNMNN